MGRLKPVLWTCGVLADFSRDAVTLGGEWELYWNQLLFPEDFIEGQEKFSELITLPGLWNSSAVSGGPHPAKGYATLRLITFIDEPDEILAIKMKEVCSSYKLWINGREIRQVGTPGKNPQETKPGYSFHVTPFIPEKSRIEIIIQISNFNYKDGGIRDVPVLGAEKMLSREKDRNLITNYILFGALIIMALYHFGLFWQRREDSSPLFFGLFCLIMTTRILVTNEMMITQFFPWYNWSLQIKTIVLGYYIGFPVFFTFICTLYPEEYNKTVIRIIQITGGIFSIAVIVSNPLFLQKQRYSIKDLFLYAVFICFTA